MNSGSDSASLMSDAQWRRFFQLRLEHHDSVWVSSWKLVGEEVTTHVSFSDLERDILDSAVDGCLDGPVDYKAIEWIEMPREVLYLPYPGAPMDTAIQEIGALREALTEAGTFPLEMTAGALKLFGYR